MSSRKSILFVNQTPNRMLNDIARVYVEQGWETVLICGSLPPETDGFVHICEFTPYNRRSMLQRLKSWRIFTAEVKRWLIKNPARFARGLFVSNPPFSIYLGDFFKKVNPGAQVALLVYDLYPDILQTFAGKSIRFLLLPWRNLNRRKFLHVDRIFTPSLPLTEAVKNYYSGPVFSVYNWVDVTAVQPIPKSGNRFLQAQKISPSSFSVLYSGNFGNTHDADTVAASLKKVDRKEIAFVFAGHGPGIEKLRKLFERDSRFHFPGWQPEEMFSHSIASGDIAMISYLPGAEGYSIPSKLPYYFAAGTPVIMIGNPDSALSRLILENKLGWVIRNGEADQLAALLNTLRSDLLTEYRTNVLAFVKASWSVDNAHKFYWT